MAQPSIHVIVKDKNGVTADENVTAVSSYNEVGLFDILPYHTNFISLLKDKVILHKIGGEIKEIKVATGLVRVYNGQILIYLGLPQASATTEGLNAARPMEIITTKSHPNRGSSS